MEDFWMFTWPTREPFFIEEKFRIAEKEKTETSAEETS